MQQNKTFCSPEQVHVFAKDVTLYERLFPVFDILDIVRTFISFFGVGKTKESIIDVETENIFLPSFTIIYSMRRSRPSVLFCSS